MNRLKRAAPVVLALILVAGGCGQHGRASSTPSTVSASGNSNGAEISARGPGMRREAADAIKLPVSPTLDLTHVDPANFAAGLGNDPVRIFDYVRDDIAYEAYAGCLRGPRGTLMAMAGNSLDRASLLASMLQAAGQRVRFAQGTLPEAQAMELVSSMWAERPAPPSPAVRGEASPSIKTALDVLSNGVKSDYTLIRDRLKEANLKIAPESAPSLDSMVKETQNHYWVQWFKDGAWVDLDPSFNDSSPGGTYASAAQTFDALPDALFHQVEIHVRLEEYTGSQVSSRVILSRRAKASDLSGVDVVLSHEPENWQGPADSLEAGLAAGITATGRVKPVLFVGGNFVTGEPFYQKGPPTGGTGGIFSQLSGAGTRHDVPIATAESIEFDFITPDGGETKVVRELFDVIGPARRGAGKVLTAEEAHAVIQANASDVTESIYALFVTTGRIDTSLLSDVVPAADPTEQVDDAVTALRRVNTAFAAISDALLPRLSTPDKTVVIFYPDSPRIQIAELSDVAGKTRLSLDLRWDHVRAAALGPHSEDVFFARSFRGVADGVLERVLIDYLTAGNTAYESEGSRLSTSLLFERMEAEGVKSVLLSREDPAFGGGISEDTRARVNQEFGQAFLVVAPERPIALGGQPRFAWWRIDPRSGEVTAVTDEGLNDALEYKAVVSRNTRGQIYGVRFFRYLPGFSGTALFTGLTQSQFLELIRDLAALGAKFSELLR